MRSQRSTPSRQAIRPPVPAKDLIARPTQVAQLDAAARGALTIVVAPPGWGKSALLAQWAHESAVPIAWIEFHREDTAADVGRALSTTVLSLDSGEHLTEAVPSPPLSSELRESLVAHLATLNDWIFVLEGLDALEPELRDALGALIEQAPAHIHFVASSRADVAFPSVTARLRARDDLAYIGPNDLAFDRSAIKEVIEHETGRAPAPEDVEVLTARTGGWPMAVRLAALACRDTGESHRTILAFDGNNPQLRALCRTEILMLQPEPVRDFLLAISIPDRVTASLCAALTNRTDSADLLALIERYQLVEPEASEPDCFRFRPLLRDVLRAELRSLQPEAEPRLLATAAQWHTARGELADLERAAQYLARTEDWSAVVAHTNAYALRMHEHGRSPAALKWILSVPEPFRRADTSVTLTEAALRTLCGETLRAESVLRALGDRRAAPAPERLAIATIRCAWVLGHLSPTEAAEAADEVLHLLETEVPTVRFTLAGLVTTDQTRAIATCVKGFAAWYQGEVEGARRLLASDLQTGYSLPITRLHRMGMLAEIEASSGSLVLARQYVAQANRVAQLALTDDHPYLVLAALANAHLHIERGTVHRARLALDSAEQLADATNFDIPKRMHASLRAWLALIEGAPRRGLEILDEQTPSIPPLPFLDARDRALAARLLVALDATPEAEQRLAYEERTTFADIAAMAAQIAVAQRDVRSARHVVATWPDDRGFQSELARDLWSAAADYIEGDADVAASNMMRVVLRAQPEGHVRLFLDAGPDVRRLLVRCSHQEPNAYLSLLLGHGPPTAAQEMLPSDQPALSPRERAVLSHLAGRMTYAEVADRLFISQNTVKSHAKSIYTKLGASGRGEAIQRAEELGLL